MREQSLVVTWQLVLHRYYITLVITFGCLTLLPSRPSTLFCDTRTTMVLVALIGIRTTRQMSAKFQLFCR